SKSPLKSGFVRGFTLTDMEREDVLNFLKSFTDMDFVTNPHFSSPFGAFCAGDCDLNKTVTVDELIATVNVALGGATLASCVVADPNGDGTVTVDEILQTVSAALNGCAQQ